MTKSPIAKFCSLFVHFVQGESVCLRALLMQLDNVMGNGAQYGLKIIECDLISHIMVLYEKYTLLMSQKHKYCYHLENVQTPTPFKVCLLCSFWLA